MQHHIEHKFAFVLYHKRRDLSIPFRRIRRKSQQVAFAAGRGYDGPSQAALRSLTRRRRAGMEPRAALPAPGQRVGHHAGARGAYLCTRAAPASVHPARAAPASACLAFRARTARQPLPPMCAPHAPAPQPAPPPPRHSPPLRRISFTTAPHFSAPGARGQNSHGIFIRLRPRSVALPQLL